MTDLSTMSLGELRQLQERIEKECRKREQQEIAKAREQIAAIAQRVGVSLTELIDNKGSKARRPAPVRYRDPDDPSKQWSGRGREPNWVKQWCASGKTRDALRVNA